MIDNSKFKIQNLKLYSTVTVLIYILLSSPLKSQDSLYTRKVIKHLTSQKCFGRGYTKGGLKQAEKFLVSELKKSGAQPLFDKKYTQSFYHSVNTFPGHCEIKINGKKLEPGKDFLPDAENPSKKGTFQLSQKDSTTFSQGANGQEVAVVYKKKLTHTVASGTIGQFIVELDTNNFKEIPKTLEVDFESKIVADFESKNVGAFIKGQNPDSFIVFTAHYDHLGGIGKKVFFPGANDNASGVSMLLNLIKHYSKQNNKYSMVFIFFAGEEAGLLGSKFFTESRVMPLNKIKFLVNLDLLGTGDEGIMVVNGAVYEKQFELLNQINNHDQLLTTIKKRGKAANSDHYWFSEKGVPAFFIYTMGGIKAYHDVYDVEKTLPLTKYRQVYQLLISFVKLL